MKNKRFITNCIRIHFLCALFPVFLLLWGCVTNYPKEIMDPPWQPEADAAGTSDAGNRPDENALAPVFYSETDKPAIDGGFTEWTGLEGISTQLVVYGGSHVPEDAEAFFALRTDGVNLYIYCRVTDDVAHENFLPGSMAWRGDTPEIFFGVNTTKHKKYTNGDNQLRLVPRSKENIKDVDIVINQRTAYSAMLEAPEGALLSAAARYTDTGYEIEASIPLVFMGINSLKTGQKIRCDFQLNDADETERDRMVHWMSDKDTAWFDPSVWGNGQVLELQQ